MRSKSSSAEQSYLLEVINADRGFRIVTCQVKHRSFDVVGQIWIETRDNSSESFDRPDPDRLVSSSNLLSCYSKALISSSLGNVSVNSTLHFDQNLSTGFDVHDDNMSLGSFDDRSELGDGMDIDDYDVLSVFSEFSESVGPTQPEKYQIDQRRNSETGISRAMVCDEDMNVKQMEETLQFPAGDFTLNTVHSRLHVCMKDSLVTQAALQEWDRLNGLPASHSRTMVNTARSRKQLQEGVILKKWDGSPLLTASTGVQFTS
jgi:hypothetical protein